MIISYQKGATQMEKISTEKAMKTALLLFMSGESMTNAVKASFELKSVINDMIDAGYTDEQIKEVWRQAERNQILRQYE